MLKLIIRIFVFFITPTASYYILKNFLKRTTQLNKKLVVLLIVSLSLINLLLYTVEYKTITTIITWLLSVLVFKIIYNQKMFESLISSVMLLVFLTIGDLLASFIMIPFFDATQARGNIYVMLLGNFLVATISLYISGIRKIKNVINTFIEKADSSKKFKGIVFLILSVILLLVVIYIVSINYKLIFEYAFAIIIFLILLILFFFYIKEYNEKSNFERNYNALLNYLETFEKIIENDRLMIHEHKNELAAIKNMKTTTQIRKYIDSTLDISDKSDKYFMFSLKKIPNGGIKGLVYYKLILAKQKNLNIDIDISSTISSDMLKFDDHTMKKLLQVIGICFDNAIEASEKSKEKKISLEMYALKDGFHCIICNTFDKSKVNISRLEEKGYSTKGRGRGNGLYYLNSIIKSQQSIKSNWVIKDRYFVRTIVVKKDK